MFWCTSPHDLHLILFISESNMDLFWSRLVRYFYSWKFDYFFQGYFQIKIRIEKFEDGNNILNCYVVFWLHTLEEFNEFLYCCMSIIVLIVSLLPKFSKVSHWNLCLCEEDKSETEDENRFHTNHCIKLNGFILYQ